MHLHFERTVNAKSDCSILSLTWMGKVPDELPEDEGWKLNRTNYYQEGWLATGNVRGIVGVTFTTSHCKKNVDFPLRTNYNLRGHRSEVILVKWNEPYQKLASCDSSGIIFVWIKYEGRWSIELINDRNTPVTHFSWSHDGRMALICYQDGFVLVGSVAGQRYWSSMLNLESTITCGIWTPDDQQVYFGTTSGQIIVMDVHGAMVSQVQLISDVGITSMAWSCEKFKMEEGDDSDPGVANASERKFVLAVSIQNGFIYLLKTFDDVSPIQINTGLQGPVCMEWSNSRELLAVGGYTQDCKNLGTQIEYNNVLKFYNEKGVLLYMTKIPHTQAPISTLTWGHNDKRLFLATGTQIHIAWISRRIASLQLLCRLRILDSVQRESQLPALPLPTRIKNLIGNLFAQTIRCCVPELSALREFVSRPPIGSIRLHCTMIRHDDDVTSGTCYTLYLEYLGGLVPLLKGKRTSKIRPEFVIFDPQVGDIYLQWSPESKSSSSSNGNSSGILLHPSDSSDSEREDGCTSSPKMPRRRKKPSKPQGRTLQGDKNTNSDDTEDLAYVDTLPEEIRLVEVTSNIWGTKFKIHGLASIVPANLGQVTYKTSLLHLQPRQMTLVMTELREDVPVGPDPSFNPNLFSEDEEESSNEKSKIPRVSIDSSPPIAPMTPRPNRMNKNSTQGGGATFLASAETHQSKVVASLAKMESYDDEIETRPNIRPNPQSTSFVGQFNRNCSSSSSQRHVISPLCCESSVPALQSPKNAVAPSDIIFDRPPAQTLLSYSSDFSNCSANVQNIKSILNTASGGSKCIEVAKNVKKENLNIQLKHSHNDFNRKPPSKVNTKELRFIDDQSTETPTPGPGPSQERTVLIPTTLDPMIRSCSVGFLDVLESQLVPNDVSLLMLHKDAPKRLVLVNRKQKINKRQSRPTSRMNHEPGLSKSTHSKAPKLKSCGKSKSLDSSDIFPNSPVIKPFPKLEETIPENSKISDKSSSSSPTEEIQADENLNIKPALVPPPITTSKLGFFSGRSPLMRRKKNNNEKKASKNLDSTSSNNSKNSGLHSQALANLEKLITRLREDDSSVKSTPPSSPRLPRSSPTSPTPNKKGKRPLSASPIRRNLLNSPLLGRRNRKSKNQMESSDDEVNASGDEVYNGTNYRDLETFQKAQLRQKLKRGKIEPNGTSNCNHQNVAQRREFVMHNKAPMWNENSQVYQLDFGGRVTQESAKNFQIEFRGKQVMQFGRIDGNAYTLDFQYPFSALQAFSVALANVTQRLK